MKKKLAVILIFILSFMSLNVSAKSNVIFHDSFEGNIKDILNDWKVYSSASTSKISEDRINKTEGNKSIKINDDSDVYSIGIYSRKVPVTPFKTYTAAADGFLYSGKAVAILRFFDDKGNKIRSINRYFTKENQWETMYFGTMAPENSKYVIIMLLSYMSDLGLASWDNVNIYESDCKMFVPPVQKDEKNSYIIEPVGDNLSYNTYNEKGDILGDYSYAGFYNGEYEIPDFNNLNIGATIYPDPQSKDDTGRIQKVIDETASKYSDDEITIIKLKKGKYNVSSSIICHKPPGIYNNFMVGMWGQYKDDEGMGLKEKNLESIYISFKDNEEKVYKYDIEISSDNKNYTHLFKDKLSDENKNEFEILPLTNVKGRYIKFIGKGNNQTEFCNVLEIIFVEKK